MSKQGRIKSQELRQARAEEARKQARRQKIWLYGGGLVALALVVAIVVVLVQATRDDSPSADGGTPANVTSTGSIPVGQADAPVTMEIYLDYMCPACGAFEQANGEDITEMIEEGAVRVELRPISFLDRTSQGTRFSTRAANAVATVADGAPELVWEMNQALFGAQPEEGTPGLSDDEIAELGRSAGVPDEVVQRFDDLEFDGWVTQTTEETFGGEVDSTPTVLIDGTEFEGDLFTPGALTAAVEAAAAE